YLLSTATGATLAPDEVKTLEEIANSLGKTNWNFSVDPCSGEQGWITPNPIKGLENNVSCNCTTTVCHVTDIILKAQSLPGVLPPELVKLPFLQTIDLTRNYLNGTIPLGWGSTRLVIISLVGNRLSGPIPKEIGNITTLTDLTLEFNQFSGPLPPELGNLKALQRMLITSNNFSGALPQTLAKLSNMKDFRISDNQFTGKIPDFIQSWTKLQKLAIQASGLEGPIPSGISLLTGLTDMRFSDLNGNGAVFPPLSNLTSLKTVILRSCNIIGEIPKYLGDFADIKLLDLSFNKLTGQVPKSFSGLSKVDFLYLSGNLLTGELPEWMLKKGESVRGRGRSNTPNIFGIRSRTDNYKPNQDLNSDVKINVLDFDEKSDANGFIDWLNRVDKILTFKKCAGQRAVTLVETKLTGYALNWWENIQQLQVRTQTVDDYASDFYLLSSRVILSESEAQWVSRFRLGLTKRIQDEMILFSSQSLSEIVEMARRLHDHMDEALEQLLNPEYGMGMRRNLFGSSFVGNDTGIVPCLKSFRCPQNYYSLNINCGGRETIINGKTKYEDDLDSGGPSRFFQTNTNWAISTTGNFMDNDMDVDNYITQNTSKLLMKDYQLYTTARLSPISLTYYGYCMLNGNYTVNLHFAEITFTSDKTFSSLGRRVFDVYIQGKRVLKDFNIEGEAGGVGKELKKNFTALVTSKTLEIRLFWAGKGTAGIPNRGVYGPLISAISVDPDFKPPSEGGKKISAGLVAGIIVSVLCLIFVIVGILWWKGCLGRKNTIDQELRGLDLQTGSFTLRQIKAATHNFDPVNKIGEGGFGPVYKGLLADGTIIAVKQLSSKSKQGNREFVNEIGMISALQHPNLVKLYGCCIEGNQLLLVYEYLENNSLARALFGPEEFRIKLDWRTRHKICVGIARGLAYLHEESRLKIVHRDIKATNVLLDKDLHPKISDFGLAKLDEEENTHISTRIAGTFGYMAPEYAMRGYLTDKADVYSFGIVALEIVSGRSNSNYRPKEECVYLLDWAMVLQQKGDLMELVDPRLGSDYKKEEVLGMLNIALACTNASSTLRPAMSSVVSMLEGRTAVKKFVSDPNVSIDDSKFKHIKESYQESRDERPVDTHTQSMLIDGPWTGSSTSANDLYPLKADSQYWNNRE
ncbi:hypothetical protein GIB67_027059, partial [Kingdonia uniflora]